jgi:hypothetical protein
MLNRKQNVKDKGIYRALLVGLSNLLLLFQNPKANQRGVNLQVLRSKSSFSSSTNLKAGLPLLSPALEVGNYKEITHLPLVMKENVSFFFFFFQFLSHRTVSQDHEAPPSPLVLPPAALARARTRCCRSSGRSSGARTYPVSPDAGTTLARAPSADEAAAGSITVVGYVGMAAIASLTAAMGKRGLLRDGLPKARAAH